MGKFAINDEFLQQIETLELILKNNTAGRFGGNHKSKTYGSSCEFADYRDYLRGDDITKIDWNAYARFEKLYLKLYLDERQCQTRIYIDASRSMDYGKSRKAEKALQIAAALAYISVAQMDKVSVYVIQDGKVQEIFANVLGKESFYNEINKLNDIEFRGDFAFSEAILPSKVGYGDGLSVIISDFLTENDYEAGIDHLVSKKRDVLAIQLLAREELKPKIRGRSHLFDSEDSQKFYHKNINRDIVLAYEEAVRFATSSVQNTVLSRGGQYVLMSDEDRISDLFFASLPEREVLK